VLLPQALQSLEVMGATLRAGTLVVQFAASEEQRAAGSGPS
jgi:hypothetical protein